MNPSVLTKEVARQVLTEVFDHVIALKFTVNEDIKVHFFLPVDPFIGPSFHKGIVFCFCDFATAEGKALAADILGLWEGTDGGGWQQWQLEFFALDGFALSKGR